MNIPGDAECWCHFVRQNVKEYYFLRHFSCALSSVWVAASVCPVFSPSFLLVQCEEDEKFSIVSSCEAGDPES